MMQISILSLCICSNPYSHTILNDPYPQHQANEKIYYASFAEQPKTLDPAKSYSLNEHVFTGQIYEPVLQYDYFVRPYKLIPNTAKSFPKIQYYDASGNEILDPETRKIAFTVYTIKIKPGILYQPHPAFATPYPLPNHYLDQHHINHLSDFPLAGTRELVADDYIYQIKRLATPAVGSSIYGLMSHYIDGFAEYAETLPNHGRSKTFIDLRHYPMRGLRSIDKYTYQIVIKGEYAQFIFWLAMNFFSPIPWEADRFYDQPGMAEKNLDFDWYPVGTGAFLMSENNPNSRIVLTKNPHYHEDYFPSNGSEDDYHAGYMRHAGERLPLIDKAIYTLEKESIPRWTKFLQGYYDLSGISADSFDQAIEITSSGDIKLTPTLATRGITLAKMIEPATYYMGFNLLDSVIGGNSARARKLRQAISIALNYEEYIAIFFNGRGLASQGPIPPGIFGYRTGFKGTNPYVYYWDKKGRHRFPIEKAQQLMRAAGYPNGRDPKTHQPLILNYDVASNAGPDDKALFDWMRKQFAKIGISLNIRSTQYNRFQEKVRTGNAQIFSWGWVADYPDPENFLFLFYGKNGKVNYGGENATNYLNPTYDRLFNHMKNHKNDKQRQHLIDRMVAIVRQDSPWVWGIHSESFVLHQPWVSPIKSNAITLSNLKYIGIDIHMRNHLLKEWNKPIWWPFWVALAGFCVFLIPFIRMYYHQEHASAKRVDL